jgi:hypothetical protein
VTESDVSALPVILISQLTVHSTVHARNVLRIPRLDSEHQASDSTLSRKKHLMSGTGYMLDPPLSHDYDRLRDFVVAR